MAAFEGASPNARLLTGQTPGSDAGAQRFGGAFSVSMLTHVAGLLLILFIMSLPAPPPAPSRRSRCRREIVWLEQKGPGGGGGGGGNKMPDPPKKAELPGKEKITVPVAKPPKLSRHRRRKCPSQSSSSPFPAQTMATGVQELPGAISNLPTMPTASQGSGSGGGAGTGTGTGIGPGRGSGLGDGEGGGTGGGVYRPGNGVISPRLLQEVKPGYTGEAMRAKIQGVVVMEAVVLPGRLDRQRAHHPLARPDLRPRSGSDQDRQEVALRARHPLRPAGAGPGRNRDDVYAAVRQQASQLPAFSVGSTKSTGRPDSVRPALSRVELKLA